MEFVAGLGVTISKEDIDLLRIIAHSVSYSFEDPITKGVTINRQLDLNLESMPNEMKAIEPRRIKLYLLLKEDIDVTIDDDRVSAPLEPSDSGGPRGSYISITYEDLITNQVFFTFTGITEKIRFEKLLHTWMLLVACISNENDNNEMCYDYLDNENDLLYFLLLMKELKKRDRLGFGVGANGRARYDKSVLRADVKQM
jgi:hypothetical protein